jgi:hypothetical protein
MPSYEDDLIKRARELQRLATRRRKLKRQLKQTDAETKTARKHLNAIKQASEGRRADAAPSRLHAGVTAVGVLHPELPKFPADFNAVPGGPADMPQKLKVAK